MPVASVEASLIISATGIVSLSFARYVGIFLVIAVSDYEQRDASQGFASEWSRLKR